MFPENFVVAKIIKKDSFIYSLLFRLFNWAYSSADDLIVIGRDMRVVLEKKTQNKNIIQFIPNWVDKNDVTPYSKENNIFIKKLGWQNNVVFYFFGNMGRVQGVNNLISAIRLVKNPKAKFLFLGNGSCVKHVIDTIEAEPSLPLFYAGEVASKNKNDGLNAGDIAIISLDEGMLGLGVPSKAYFSMAANKPLLVIADPESEISLLAKEHKIGWCCDINQQEKLAALCDKIAVDFTTIKLNSSREIFE